MKLRLGAIAKDEAAYLPEWIHHHLYFGFDDIEVIVNNTQDNTVSVLDKISGNHPVRFSDVGVTATDDSIPFQRRACAEMLRRARRDKVTHMLFLDIDEFWTPASFEESIYDAMLRFAMADIVSFEWALKFAEPSDFCRPFQSTNQITWNRHLKSVFRTNLKISRINPHNVVADGASNVLADGLAAVEPCTSKLEMSQFKDRKAHPRPYFICHRFWRSQREYVALLGQGMKQYLSTSTKPESSVEADLMLQVKTNREGFEVKKGPFLSQFRVGEANLAAYDASFSEFVAQNGLESDLDAARSFVRTRSLTVAAALSSPTYRRMPFVKKVGAGVNLSAVLNGGHEAQ